MADNVGNADARPDLELEERVRRGRGHDQRAGDGRGRGRLRPGGRRRSRWAAATPAATPRGVTRRPPAGIPAATRPASRRSRRPPASRRRALAWASVPAAARRRSPTRSAPASRRRASSRGRSRARCNLSCAHCRAAAEFGHYHGELSLDEIKATIDDIVTISNPIIILTGGEPLMRPDIWEIVDYAHEKGAMPVIGTNATLITDDIAAKMAEHKIPRISVSIDFPTAEEHDAFRGAAGLLRRSRSRASRWPSATASACRSTRRSPRDNAHQIEEIHDLAESLGIDAFHIFMLVPDRAAAATCSTRSCRPRSTSACSRGRTTARRRARCTSSPPTRRTTTASSASSPRPRARRSRARSTGSTR